MKFFVAMGDCPVRRSFFTPRAVAEMKRHGEVVLDDSSVQGLDKARLIDRIGDADVLFTGWGTARVDEDVLRAAPRLKIHAHTGGAVSSYVSREEYDRGVLVLSGNDLYAQSVAEGCLSYTLNALRRSYTYMKTVRDGGWQPTPNYTQGLIGKKVALVGYGAIARYYADLLRWFKVDLYVVSEHISRDEIARIGAKKVSLEEAMSVCDVISLHLALNEKTRNAVTREHLKLIRDGALLINTARADLIERGALYSELATGRFDAVLDVYYDEPLPADDPLRAMRNVLLMPHVCGPTYDMREQVVLRLIDDALLAGEGKPCRDVIPYDYAVRMTVH